MMKKTSIITTAMLCIASAGAYAQSAKFAATYTETPSLGVNAFVTCSTTDATPCVADVNDDVGHTLAYIKVPQDKELLVGVSAEIGLATFGAIKGKNGGSGTSVADAEATVTLHACRVEDGMVTGDCDVAKPAGVTLSKRVQELSAKLGGVIEECTFTAVDPAVGDTTINIADDCTVNDEEIALLLSTVAAHHFNFVLPDMDQGDYAVKATFATKASAAVYLCDPRAYDLDGTIGVDYTTEDCDSAGYAAGTAAASSIINKSMVTVQQVRATSDGIIDATEIVSTK